MGRWPGSDGAARLAVMEIPKNRRWGDLSPRGRLAVVFSGMVQLALLGAALADLRRREAGQLNGPRWMWVLLSFVNFVGPLSYFAIGRKRTRGVDDSPIDD